MSTKVKFLLVLLILGLLTIGIGWGCAVRFDMDIEIASAVMQVGGFILSLALFVGVVSIFGFKRLIKWMYFVFVITFVIMVMIIAPFTDFLVMAILGILSLALVLTLIPIFKAHK